MAIIVWRDMNTYQKAMYLINGDSFNCNLFYLNYFAGRMYPKELVMCQTSDSTVHSICILESLYIAGCSYNSFSELSFSRKGPVIVELTLYIICHHQSLSSINKHTFYVHNAHTTIVQKHSETVTVLPEQKRTRGLRLYIESDRDVSGSHIMTCYIHGPQI